MPIVAHNSLPTFANLRAGGEPVLTRDEAAGQDIRELHIGLLNMMPDAALAVTEQQFLRLVGASNTIVQLWVHPFTIKGLPRDSATRAYIDEHYESFDDLRAAGLDALIVSGANVANPKLADEPFWEPLIEIVEWAHENVTSVLCSCLASHALVQHFYGVHRRRMQNKKWGVFPHRLADASHPLLRGTNTRFDVPHSRWNTVTSAMLRDVGAQVLIETLDGDFHLGTSPDGFRTVYLQGHPEYDAISLLKEYKRELDIYLTGAADALPPFPQNYLSHEASRILADHVESVLTARDAGRATPPFPDDELAPVIDNTWTDTGKAVFNNWLGLVYRLTHVERGVPFMDGVDPDDPLGLRG
jgi:homoserine O-succinyltransferase